VKKVGVLAIASILMLFSSCEKLRYDLVPTRIEGKVIDILTGEPIPFAEITLWKSEYYRSREVAFYQADAEGNFKIKHKFKYYKDDPPKDYYHISAKKDGYLKNVNRSKYELKIDVNDEAIARIEPTRSNKDIVLKLIPICTLELDVEDVYPYYELQNNITNYLYLRFKPLETSTIGWSYYGSNEVQLKNYITEFKIDMLSAGKYQLILYERDKNYNGTIVHLIDTFYVDLKPNQVNKINLYF
jgi:DNA-binding XRE family transcriptional regulator